MKRWLVLVAVVGLAACDASRDGREAYDEGRFLDALSAFRLADDGTSAEIAYDRALAALRAGELEDAEKAADAAAEIDPESFVPLRDFLRGNVAYAHCLAAEIETFRPGADLSSYDRAVALAEIARRHWVAAAMSRGDWSEARRNVERAVLMAQRLAARKAEAAARDERTRRPKAPQAKPVKPETAPRPKEPPRETESKVLETELSRADVLAILDRLAQVEHQKLDVRRTRRATQPAAVEKDW